MSTTSMPDSVLRSIWHPTAGAKFFGAFFATALWSGFLVQLWTYHANYPNDRRLLKIWVFGVFLTATTGIILLIGSLYRDLVMNFGDFMYLLSTSDKLCTAQFMIMGMTAAQVQSFFAYRIWRLSQNILVTTLLGICVLGQMSAWIAITTIIWGIKTPGSHRDWTTAIAVITCCLDIALAVVLCYLLLSQRESARGRTQIMVRRIMVFALGSGLVTAMLALVVVILLFVLPRDNLFFGIYGPTQAFYANSMLAALNARGYITQSGDNIVETDIDVPTSIHFANRPKSTSAAEHQRSRTAYTGGFNRVSIQLGNLGRGGHDEGGASTSDKQPCTDDGSFAQDALQPTRSFGSDVAKGA